MQQRGLDPLGTAGANAAAADAPSELLREVRQLSRLHELTRRLLAAATLDEALQEVLDASIELLGADFGAVQLLQADGVTLSIAVQRGFAPELREPAEHARRADDASVCAAAALRTHERCIVPDLRAAAVDDALRRFAAHVGFRALQSTPLVGNGGRLCGVLSTHWREPHSPAEPELRLLDLYAQQATHYIERMRATQRLQASERRHGFLVSLHEATQNLSDPAEIMAETARRLGEHLGADRCAYAQVEADEDHFVITGNYGPRVPSIVGRWALSRFGGEVLRLMRAKATCVVHDSANDPRTRGFAAAYDATQIRAAICTPLHKAGRLVACMAVHQATARQWTADDVELLEIVAAHCWDVLERARALQQLAESEARFREMADTSPVLIWLSGADKTATWFNRPWLDFVGLSLAAMLDGGWSGSIHPDDLGRARLIYGSAFDARQPFSMEYRLRRHDGSYRWVLDTGVPRYGSGAVFAGYIGSCIDITERKLAERRLSRRAAEQSALYRYTDRLQRAETLDEICDAALDAIGEALRCDRCAILLMRKGRMRFVAWRGLSERYRTAVDGHSPWDADTRDPLPICIDDVAASALPETLKATIAGEGIGALAFFPLQIDAQLIGKFMIYFDGRHAFSERQTELAMTLARQLGFAIDRQMTEEEQRKAELALFEANRRKDEFLAMLAHELRNPLAPIRNSLALLAREGGDPSVFSHARDILDRQTRHLVRLVDDLLDVSRITQNKLELRRERIDLADAIASAIETCTPAIDEAGHRLHLDLPDEPLPVDADPVRLAQVFANLLNNAAKYSERGGDITVSARRDGDSVSVSVRDTGVGIPPELLSRIFDMFVQGDHSLERARGGLGIGLTLVQRLVQMHGGSVTVHSAGAQRGSTFSVRMPLASTPITIAAAGTGAGRHRAAGHAQQLRVLIADDNEDAASSLAEILELGGHETRIAHDGQAAVELAEAFRPDVALLDLGMPRLNGYDAARRIRARQPGVRLIALTGWSHAQDRARSHDAGFDHHLVKPVDLGVLQDVLGATPH
ncbi:GAF domain-containing protein [Solimonas soli]|uniref:GAF domain-containing protein n=1 Tax=Solimonas soli TaxID=413479 RepID=UPI0004AC7A18|nr:GAF domain-containing protein [Solimonas soli]